MEFHRTVHDRKHFDGIADRYTGKDLVPSSRYARRHRLERLLAGVPLRSTWRVLEVGCGAGFAATYLEGRYDSYIGVDHSEELIRAARRHNSGPNVEFAAASIAEFDSGSNFDLVFMVGVLHHLDRRPAIMARIRQLLRPGGYLAVNEPQPSNPLVSFARRIRASLDGSYSDDQDEISPGEMHSLFAAAGFTEIQITPQGLFSTPFAEVPMRPDFLAGPASRLACIADSSMESRFAGIIRPLTWNLSGVGRRPQVFDPDNQNVNGGEP